MSIKKRNKHDHSSIMHYMHLLEQDYSFNSIHTKYGINCCDLKILWAKYRSQGPSGLIKVPQKRASFDLVSKP